MTAGAQNSHEQKLPAESFLTATSRTSGAGAVAGDLDRSEEVQQSITGDGDAGCEYYRKQQYRRQQELSWLRCCCFAGTHGLTPEKEVSPEGGLAGAGADGGTDRWR